MTVPVTVASRHTDDDWTSAESRMPPNQPRKASREWPRRKPHKAPSPPKFLTLDEDQKALLQQHIGAA